MWLLKWLPNWIFYTILVVGLLGLVVAQFVKFIPVVNTYKKPIQLASLAAVVIGTFMAGAIYDNEAWVARVDEMKAKVAQAEVEAKEANAKLDAKTDELVTQRKQKQVVIKQYIDREITKYDNTCVIPKEFVEIHNKAASK